MYFRLMPPAPPALCPECKEPLTRWVHKDRKYWYCEDPDCHGNFKGTHPTCPTRGCEKSMRLKTGPKGHWFWSCPLDACTAQPAVSGWNYHGNEDPQKKKAKWGNKL